MKGITAMVVVQIASAGLNILFKLSVEDGMNPRVLVAYRLFFATLFMFPMSFIFQRKKRPEFTWRLLLLALLSGILGAVLPTLLTVTGLALTSATFTSAAGVLTPLITFILAALLRQVSLLMTFLNMFKAISNRFLIWWVTYRMESVRLGSSEGKANVVGTMLGVGGALVFIFYRGKAIHLWSTHVDLVNQTRDSTTHHISFFGALLVYIKYSWGLF
ncbi:unnamed protein product [Microthlaspi erraticum]|uniref:WAT1-related protein n=1 Tax=Microthlaspi erraticum TaxID=1685480 RepID=A0A6D2JMZ7_9BRAS|nr:unnamed protein product [Microthlaspi erraticum]